MISTRTLTRTALFLALALAIQLLRFPQPITGPAINALLLLAALMIGPWPAVLIGCLTPGVALLVGIIPPIVSPLVPFIMLANAILILVFYGISQAINPTRGSFYLSSQFRSGRRPAVALYSGMGLAALAKFGFLYLITQFAVQWFYQLGWIKAAIPSQALLTFQLPQLYTALIGGILAVTLYRYLLPQRYKR